MAATSLSGEAIGRGTAQLHALLGSLLLVLMVRLAWVGSQEWERSSIWGLGGALAGAAFLLPSWLLARLSALSSRRWAALLIGAAVFGLLLHVRRNRGTGAAAAGDDRASDLLRASLSYLVLLGLILATRLIGPLRVILQEVPISWRLFAMFEGSIAPPLSPRQHAVDGVPAGRPGAGSAHPRARAGRGRPRSKAAGARMMSARAGQQRTSAHRRLKGLGDQKGATGVPMQAHRGVPNRVVRSVFTPPERGFFKPRDFWPRVTH